MTQMTQMTLEPQMTQMTQMTLEPQMTQMAQMEDRAADDADDADG